MGLNQKQKEAVEYLDGPLLVLAGPGTGKTQLLSEKVAYILKNTDTNPENILCMTFTESGVSNMKERLKSIVGAEGAKVHVSTYHSFGSEILAQYSNYSTEYMRKLDSAIDEVTQFKIVKELQDALPGNDILRKDNVKDIISVISSAKSAGLTAEALDIIAKQNIADSKVLSQSISPLLKNVVPRVFKESYDKAYRPIYEALAKYLEEPVLIDFGEESAPPIERSIVGLARDLKTAIVEAETTEKIKPLSSWKDAYFEKDGRGNYRLRDRVANLKLTSIANLMRKYGEYLEENGLFDFDDMIQEAIKVLEADAGFLATLSERYQFIMLDEFQDTNPSQFKIIKQLTDYEKPMIMAVGDDDQAIYEFQGALSTNLVDFQNHYGANVIPLVENYRSTQEILDFSRQVINQATDRFADKELLAHKPAPVKSQVYRYEFRSSDMEYGFIAKKIHELIKSGVKQSEIAIISYKTKYFLPLLPYLKSYSDINIAYERKNNLFENQQIHQLLTICRYVWELANERNENTSIVEILSYPFFDLPMIEIIKTIGAAKRDKKSVFEYLAKSENQKVAEVTNFIANLVAKSYDEPLELFLNYVIGVSELDGYSSPFLRYYSAKDEYEAFTFYENLASLKGRLTRHFGEKPLRLNDLIVMVNDYEQASMPLNASSPYRDAEDSVQVLTAHKAKGLEFEHVFIISADHSAWGKGKGNNNLLALPKNLMQIRHTGTTDGEKLRILYVALTRAKSHLYITNSVSDFNGKSPARLEYFEEYDDGEGNIISPFLPSQKVKTFYEVREAEALAQNLKNWLNPYVKLSPDMKAIYGERVAKYRMSASSLSSFIDIVYAGPQTFFKNYVLQVPREPDTEALVMGNLVHAVFEAVTNKHLSDEKAIDLFLDELAKIDLPSDEKKKIREKGVADLAVALEAFGDLLRQGKAEVDLASEKLEISGVPVTGKIDHVLIDDEAKTIEIYDFKTGGYHKEKWQSHATLYKYMLQLGFYKLLLNSSPTYSKYKVERAHILFVTPDKDGQVYDKVYEFNEHDEEELKKLMRSVYDLITSLKFIEDEDVFLAPDSSKGLKDIKNFVALVLEKHS